MNLRTEIKKRLTGVMPRRVRRLRLNNVYVYDHDHEHVTVDVDVCVIVNVADARRVLGVLCG